MYNHSNSRNKGIQKKPSIQKKPQNTSNQQEVITKKTARSNSRDINKPSSKPAVNRTIGSVNRLPPNSQKKIEEKTILASTKNIPKATSQIPKPSSKINFPKINNTRKKVGKNIPTDGTWSTIPVDSLISICEFACTSFFQVYQFSKVCSLWRSYLSSQMGECFWRHIKGGEQIVTFFQMKSMLQKNIVIEQEKASLDFQKSFTKLFNYGSTKQNIPNKLLQKLDLEIQLKVNKDQIVKQAFKLRSFNFSSYLCMKVAQISEYKYDFSTPHNMFKDKINLEVNFKSKKYKVAHMIKKSYVPEEIYKQAIKQKAFNYYLDKNFVFTLFQGDNHFLYIFFEISALELVNIFRQIIKQKHNQTLKKRAKKVPMYKQLCETQFQSFTQYMKFQADFQIHFSYHNSLKQIFTHCDTKVYPIEIRSKEAYFEVKIDDTFEKVATYKLDNKMGMSESVQDLYLLDFILKDRDRFLIIFSGFIYARNATQKERESIDDYFNFSENQIKMIQYKKEKQYDIQFVIIEQAKRNYMKKVSFTMFSSMISL